ncbi:hypothetical protein F4703DRAFT_1201577 [Phycomyces blakesleeanus]
MDLMVASNNIHNRILFCSQNLLEQLPLEPISQKVDKLGLITRYTSAAINPLLENLIKHVMFRWTSVANNKCKSCEMALLLARPDSTISKVMGTEIGQTVGYEEVKPALQALNRELVGKDLVRLALLSKKKTRLIRIVANLSWCFLSLLPISLKEFPLFIPKAEHFALVSSVF